LAKQIQVWKKNFSVFLLDYYFNIF
jgi:hypothetical protein